MPDNPEYAGLIRAWFCKIATPDDIAEMCCYLKGMAEEAVLSGTSLTVEVWIPKWLPQLVREETPQDIPQLVF